MRTIAVFIDSRNELDIDELYRFFRDNLEFQDCNNDRALPFTMLIKQDERSVKEISGLANSYIQKENLDISNLVIAELSDFIHTSSELCDEI